MASGILFLCVANSSRSQMAHALAKHMAPAGTWIDSAGSEPTQVNPFAIAAMKEIGIDLSSHVSKSTDDVDKERVGTVITLCAEEVCPVFSGEVTRLHWPHDDPAAVDGTNADKLAAFCRVRDQIRDKLTAYFEHHQ